MSASEAFGSDERPDPDSEVAEEIDLSSDVDGIPGAAAEIDVTIQKLRFGFWEFWFTLDQRSTGRHSWLIPWFGLVLLTAVAAGFGSAVLLVPEEAAATRLTVAAATALSIFTVGGLLALVRYLISRKDLT